MTTRGKGSVTFDYLAGFFDGEGSIIIAKINNKRSGNIWYRLNISCSNSHKEIMEVIHNRLSPKRKNLLYQPGKKESYKPSYQWLATGNVALETLKKLLPFLRVKKKQAKVGIQFQEWRNLDPRPGKKRTKEEMRKCERYRMKLKILNGTASRNEQAKGLNK